MRRVTFLVCALLAAVALSACTGVSQTTSTNDVDAQTFVDTTIPAIVGHWNVDALVSVADPSVYTQQRVHQARRHFGQLAKALGPMITYAKATGTTQTLRTNEGETKHASFTASVGFKRGSATIYIDADKAGGKWLVENLAVQPAKPLNLNRGR